MRRVAIAMAALLLAAAPAGPAGAVPPGFAIEFDGNGEGKVTFTGAKHTGPGMHCSNCHMDVFYVSRNSRITRADHRRRQACFTCHDGEKAFASKKNCDRCHVEPEPELAAAAEAEVPAAPAASPED